MTRWDQIAVLLSAFTVKHIQNLEVLDVSYIAFELSTFTEPSEIFPSLQCLVLENCRVTERELSIMGKVFPVLQKLVLKGLRGFSPSVFYEGFSNLTQLDVSKCGISTFEELEPIGTLNSLHELKLCKNPLNEILNVSGFENLRVLNVEGISIELITSVYRLNSFRGLRELRVTETPLALRFADSFRMMLISYLPNISRLNGGTVTDKERVTQERQFVREFSHPNWPTKHITCDVCSRKDLMGLMSMEEIPVNICVFEWLSYKHGVVEKFADFIIKRPTKVMLNIKLKGNEREVNEETPIPLRWNVGNLKELCQKKFGILKEDLLLSYGDYYLLKLFGYKRLYFDTTSLKTLNLKDGDMILVSTRSNR